VLGKDFTEEKSSIKEKRKKVNKEKEEKKVGSVDIYSMIGKATIDKKTALAWAKFRAADFGTDINQVEKIVNYYYELAPKINLNPTFVLVQSAHETAFWSSEKFQKLNNPAGIKTSDATKDDFKDFQNFSSIKEGIEAHISHVACYNGIESSLFTAPRTVKYKNLIFGKGADLKSFCAIYASDDFYEKKVKNLVDQANGHINQPNKVK